MKLRQVRSTSLAALSLIAIASACQDAAAPVAPSNEFTVHLNPVGNPGSTVTLCKEGAAGEVPSWARAYTARVRELGRSFTEMS